MKVRDVIKLLEADGGYMLSTEGRNAMAGSKTYHFLIILEQGEHNYSAYAPDLPGCAATGKTYEEVKKNMREAIKLHLQGMIEDHEPIPNIPTFADYVDVSIPESAA
jgi:predicted RNase H-like HicB family nuclease